MNAEINNNNEEIVEEMEMEMDTCECTVCGDSGATACMDDMCADCYWDADAERKKAVRSDPVWRFNRLCSYAMTCMALKTMDLTEPPKIKTA